MAEDGWTQGVCQEEPGIARLLINSLERFGITERPRYYNTEYEQLGTLRCRVVLSIARSNRYPNIEPWCVTATGFRHRDTYPRPSENPSATCVGSTRNTSSPHRRGIFPRHQNPCLAGPHEKPGMAPPPRRPFVPCGCLPRLPEQTL
jgi:hypothetical protein